MPLWIGFSIALTVNSCSLTPVEIPDSTGGEISLSADEREPPKVEDL